MSESLVWVDVPCPLCGARRDEPILMAPTQHGTCRLARCGACDMVYLNPRPSDETLGQLYPDDYEPYQGAVSDPARPGLVTSLRRHALARYEGYPPGPQTGVQRAVAPLGKFLLDWQGDSLTHLPWVGEGRLLDYGCGSGWYAARMREMGWHVTGMDFNPASLLKVVQRYRLPVIAGALPHPKVKPESFDVITMGSVLEHMPNPNATIAAACQALAPGGLLVLAVPNIVSWGYRAFGPDWHGLELPRHLLHFSPATLRSLVERHGLEVREVSHVARPGWLRRSLHAARQHSDKGIARRLMYQLASWRPISRLMGQWSAETKQADMIKLVAMRPTRGAMRLAA